MSTVGGIGASAFSQTSGSGVGQLSSDAFFKLIFSELTNQDPLKPNDTNALLTQIANIQSIQSDTNLVDNLGKLVGQNELTAGAGLIGSTISGLSDTSQRVSGLVDSVSKGKNGVVLNLADGTRVPMKDVDLVLAGGSGNGSGG